MQKSRHRKPSLAFYFCPSVLLTSHDRLLEKMFNAINFSMFSNKIQYFQIYL